MKHILHPANERGVNKNSWLDTKFSFSFAHWYDPSKINFGALRVLNDDAVAPLQGFGMHPHDNMEIVTIMLEGELQHKDSMGHTAVISEGEVQYMSAGTGIMHSEMNPNSELWAKLFQIWVFPQEYNLKPQYGQKQFNSADRQGIWQYYVTPTGENGSLQMQQHAFFARTELKIGGEISYSLHGEYQGIYCMVISGEADINGIQLGQRDAVGVWEIDSITIRATSDCDILLIEVPMR